VGFAGGIGPADIVSSLTGEQGGLFIQIKLFCGRGKSGGQNPEIRSQESEVRRYLRESGSSVTLAALMEGGGYGRAT
jgi:hypothetical protein